MESLWVQSEPLRVLIVGTADAARAAAALLRSTGEGAAYGFLLCGDGAQRVGAGEGDEGATLFRNIDEAASALRGSDAGLVLLVDGAARRLRGRIERTLRGAEVVEWPSPPRARGRSSSGIARAASSAPVDPLTLVGRSGRVMDEDLVRRAITGRRVLITGAGGSIGSELARLAARFEPSLLVLVERSENALFEIDREIGSARPETARLAALHDVVDAKATLRRFIEWRPEVVFHAAAHKHVPMMENHPAHAINNNLFGAKSVADASVAIEAERFVLISTDKAVNPSSVMGATKLLAERYVRSCNDERAPRRFRVVRFGNVLASACSVLPIWERQIAEGGPVTVTDPRMTRYFMTIPEAASLVLQAAGLDEAEADADVFVLDMGSPVSILDLARRFVTAHGLRAVEAGEESGGGGTPMPIEVVGARPGEKIHEELVHDPAALRATRADGLLAWSGEASDPVWTRRMTAAMARVRFSSDHAETLRALREWIPLPGAAGASEGVSGHADQAVRPSPPAHAA